MLRTIAHKSGKTCICHDVFEQILKLPLDPTLPLDLQFCEVVDFLIFMEGFQLVEINQSQEGGSSKG